MNAIVILLETLPVGWAVEWFDGEGTCLSYIRDNDEGRQYIVDTVKNYANARLIKTFYAA